MKAVQTTTYVSWIFCVWINKVIPCCNCVHMLTGQDEMENIICTADELDENDSLALYFCSPKVTANGKYTFLHIYIGISLQDTPKGHTYHKQQKMEELKFDEFGDLCCFAKLYLPIAQNYFNIHVAILAILDEFAKLSSAKQIYWQVRQTLVPPIFHHLR